MRDKKYVCITDLMNKARDIENKSIKLSDVVKYPSSSLVIKSFLSPFGIDLKDEPVTLMVLKREGFAKRVGKGDGQKWMMEFNLSFVLLFLAFGSLAYDLLYDNI